MTKYTYKQLCKFFKEEEKPKGNRRITQFKRWEKEYNITKIPHTNSYTLEKKPLDIQESSQQKVDLKTLIEPMICDLFIQEDTRHLGTSQSDLHERLGLVNGNFFALGYNNVLKEQYAKELNITVDQLTDYKDAVYDLNKQTINNVLKSLAKKGVLIIDRTYKLKHHDGNVTYANENYKIHILGVRNKVSKRMTGLFYNEIKDKYVREKVLKEINKELGIASHYDAIMLHLDIESIKIYLSEKYPEYISYNSNKTEVNKKNRNKIIASTRGDLKDISLQSKKKVTAKIIALSPTNIIAINK